MEIETLAAEGVCEVMLLGQNVNSYGKTLENPISFAELLRRVERICRHCHIEPFLPHPASPENLSLSPLESPQ